MTTLRLARLLSARRASTVVVGPPSSPLHAEAERVSQRFVQLEPRLKYGDVSLALRLALNARRERLDTLIFFRSQDIHLGIVARVLHPSLRIVFYQQMQSGIAKTDPLHTFVYRRLSAWFTLTKLMRDEVLQWTNVDPVKVVCVPLGRDGTQFAPGHVTSTKARRILRIPQKAFVIGVLGRLDRQKGQLELIRAIPRVKKRVPGVFAIIAGDETKNDPGMRAELEKLVVELGLSRSVRILPPTNDVAQFLSALDVFVMPSYSETYGLVLLEAMAMQIPVVATNSGGVPEIVRNGDTGLLVEPKAVDELADALLRLARDRKLRRSIAKAGRERFLDTFEERACVDILVEKLENHLS